MHVGGKTRQRTCCVLRRPETTSNNPYMDLVVDALTYGPLPLPQHGGLAGRLVLLGRDGPPTLPLRYERVEVLDGGG